MYKKQYGYSNYGSLYKESEQSLRIHGVIALSFVSLMSERYWREWKEELQKILLRDHTGQGHVPIPQIPNEMSDGGKKACIKKSIMGLHTYRSAPKNKIWLALQDWLLFITSSLVLM